MYSLHVTMALNLDCLEEICLYLQTEEDVDALLAVYPELQNHSRKVEEHARTFRALRWKATVVEELECIAPAISDAEYYGAHYYADFPEVCLRPSKVIRKKIISLPLHRRSTDYILYDLECRLANLEQVRRKRFRDLEKKRSTDFILYDIETRARRRRTKRFREAERKRMKPLAEIVWQKVLLHIQIRVEKYQRASRFLPSYVKETKPLNHGATYYLNYAFW